MTSSAAKYQMLTSQDKVCAFECVCMCIGAVCTEFVILCFLFNLFYVFLKLYIQTFIIKPVMFNLPTELPTLIYFHSFFACVYF